MGKYRYLRHINNLSRIMEYIGIFCSASANIDTAYFETTRLLGKWIGSEGKTIIYGGANIGLMECIAKAVKESGGRVTGVVPGIMEQNGRVSDIPDEIIYTRDLSDRKDKITELSDVLVALPGGIGTLDEAFHVMSAATIGYHNKKVVFYNVNGFYDGLFAFLKQIQEANFSRRPVTCYYEVANTLDELKTIIG